MYAATSRNDLLALHSTCMTGIRERGKNLLKEITRQPKTPKAARVFRELKVDPQLGRKVFASKQVSPARRGIFVPKLQERYENSVVYE